MAQRNRKDYKYDALKTCCHNKQKFITKLDALIPSAHRWSQLKQPLIMLIFIGVRGGGAEGQLNHCIWKSWAIFYRILPKYRQFLLKTVISRAICARESGNFCWNHSPVSPPKILRLCLLILAQWLFQTGFCILEVSIHFFRKSPQMIRKKWYGVIGQYCR